MALVWHSERQLGRRPPQDDSGGKVAWGELPHAADSSLSLWVRTTGAWQETGGKIAKDTGIGR